MKTLLFALLFVGQAAFSAQATPLIELERNLGFFANFKTEKTVIDSEGLVVKTTTDTMSLGKTVVTTAEIALLSESALENLKASVANVNADLKLEAEPGEGPAVDVGSETVVVYKEGVAAAKTIYNKSQGKTYFLQYHTGSQIVNLIKALDGLN